MYSQKYYDFTIYFVLVFVWNGAIADSARQKEKKTFTEFANSYVEWVIFFF